MASAPDRLCRAIQDLRRGIASRPRPDGRPHAFSAIFCPLLWLAAATDGAPLRQVMVNEDLPADLCDGLRNGLRQAGISSAGTLRAWLHHRGLAGWLELGAYFDDRGQTAVYRAADPPQHTMYNLQRITNSQRRAAREPTPEDWRARLPRLLLHHLATETEHPEPPDWSPLLTAALQPTQGDAQRKGM